MNGAVPRRSKNGTPRMPMGRPGTSVIPRPMPGNENGTMPLNNSSRQKGEHEGGNSARSNSVPSVRSTVGPFKPNHTYFPEVGNFTLTAIPGYGGHIPGKIAENVIASTYNRSNQLAAVQCEERLLDDHTYSQQPRNVAMHNPFGITLPHRRGTDIPGYQGFVPGRYADGVFGHVQARANNISMLLKQRQYADKVAWLDKIYN